MACVAVLATHEEPALALAHVVLPAAAWAEREGTFTNHQRRVQRFRRAFAAPGDARAGFELLGALLRRLGAEWGATSARDVFALLAAAVPDYAGLDYKAIGSTGRVLGTNAEPAAATTGAGATA